MKTLIYGVAEMLRNACVERKILLRLFWLSVIGHRIRAKAAATFNRMAVPVYIIKTSGANNRKYLLSPLLVAMHRLIELIMFSPGKVAIRAQRLRRPSKMTARLMVCIFLAGFSHAAFCDDCPADSFTYGNFSPSDVQSHVDYLISRGWDPSRVVRRSNANYS